MAKKPKSFNAEIDSLLEGLELPSDADVRRETGNKKGALKRELDWKTNPNRRIVQSIKSRQSNKLVYGGYKWILCSPGNDLLAYYDAQNKLLGKDNRAYSAIPPSIVYHYRFEHNYPKEIFDKSKNYGRNAYLRDKLKHLHHTYDHTYWGQVYNSRYNWLVDRPHDEWVFDSRVELTTFMEKMFPGNKTFGFDLSVHGHITKNGLKKKTSNMFWRGILKGWSIHIVPLEEYEQLKGKQ